MKTSLRELVDLATDRELSEEELDRAMVTLLKEFETTDGEFAWINEACGEDAPLWRLIYALYYLLSDENSTAASDNWGNIHEQISDQFAEPLPDYPDGMSYLHDYLQWIDKELDERGYELLEYPEYFTDELHVICVPREYTGRILELTQKLDIGVKRALDSHMRAIGQWR